MVRSMTYSINCKTKWANYLCRGTLEFKGLALIILCNKVRHIFDKCFIIFCLKNFVARKFYQDSLADFP